jgi:hypothetical protein
MLSRRVRNVTVLILIHSLLWAGSCKREGGNLSKQASDPVQVANYRKGVERGMKPVTFDALTRKHVGKRCVVTADTLAKPLPTPPPRGMVMVFGDVSVYTAELESVSPDRITVCARYPSGKLKSIEISAADIQAISIE